MAGSLLFYWEKARSFSVLTLSYIYMICFKASGMINRKGDVTSVAFATASAEFLLELRLSFTYKLSSVYKFQMSKYQGSCTPLFVGGLTDILEV